MALIFYSSHLLLTKNPNLLYLPSPAKPTILSIKSQDPSTELPKPTIATQKPDGGSPSAVPPLPKKPTSSGLGFGSSSSPTAESKANTASTKKKQRGKVERASSIIRRAPVGNPGFVSRPEEVQAKEQSNRSESVFLLAWLGLGAIILVEGIALAASGFLPEDWDEFFVKYLYPAFTPTVFLFVAGTVTYGVLKYLQNEKLKSQK